MNLSDAMQKSSPVNYRKIKENKSDFKKIVDRNAELVDENKELKQKIEGLNINLNNISNWFVGYIAYWENPNSNKENLLPKFKEFNDKLQEYIKKLNGSDKE